MYHIFLQVKKEKMVSVVCFVWVEEYDLLKICWEEKKDL